MKKILLLCTTSSSVINFRKGLIKTLKENDFQVGVVVFDSDRKEEILSLGVDFFELSTNNRSINPLKKLELTKKYQQLIENYQPNIVFSFQATPNTFGVLAARKAGIKHIFAMVEGLGDPFTYNSPKWLAIRLVISALYKLSLRYVDKVFFLNNDDIKLFIDNKLVKQEQAEVIHGIGVDLDYFAQKPVKNTNTFLMVARLTKAKGIFEFCKAARIVKQTHPEAVFNLLGEEFTLKKSDIQEYIDDGSINYLGYVKDVRPYLEDTLLLLLLSSYREGLPMSIMEAEATGRAVITTDNVGCRDTVIDGYNGFLVKNGDYKAMAEKCIYALEHTDEMITMCNNAREYAEAHFDKKKINGFVLSFLNR